MKHMECPHEDLPYRHNHKPYQAPNTAFTRVRSRLDEARRLGGDDLPFALVEDSDVSCKNIQGKISY